MPLIIHKIAFPKMQQWLSPASPKQRAPVCPKSFIWSKAQHTLSHSPQRFNGNRCRVFGRLHVGRFSQMTFTLNQLVYDVLVLPHYNTQLFEELLMGFLFSRHKRE